MSQLKRIAIIGGGVSGLTACHYIRRLIPSAHVSLFEKQSRFGGWIKSTQFPNNVIVESGPNSIRGGNNDKTLILSQLINDLNLGHDVIGASEEANDRFIFYDNKLYELKRIALKCFLSSMIWMPYQQIYYYLKGGHKNRYKDETVFDFFNRNCGPKVTNILVSSFVNGVYGGGINHLSMKSCSPFNVLKDVEMQHGSYFVGGIKQMTQRKAKQLESNDTDTNTDADTIMKMTSFSFKYGLQQLVDALVDTLIIDDNVTLYNNFSVEAMRYSHDKQCIEIENNHNKCFEFDHVLNAIQPSPAASFLDSNCNMNNFNETASLLTVNVIFKNERFVNEIIDKFKGFGVLLPSDVDSLLGIIYYSTAFGNDDDSNTLSLVFMFGGTGFDPSAMTEKQITTLCKLKLKQIYDIHTDEMNKTETVFSNSNDIRDEDFTNADVVYNINRLHDAINHYLVGHQDKVQSFRDHLANVYHDKVSIIGSGYDGVGIHDCVTSAYQSVQKLKNIPLTETTSKAL